MHVSNREVIQITSAPMDLTDNKSLPNLIALCSDQSLWWYSPTTELWTNIRDPLTEHEGLPNSPITATSI